MLLVYLTGGECVEVPAGASVASKNDTLFCYDAFGRELASFPKAEVEVYTFDEREAEIISEEACEDVSVVGEAPAASPPGA
jgi:hypothetical protein